MAQEKKTIIHTDSSVIITICSPGSYKLVEEKFKKDNRVHSISYFTDTLTIHDDSYNDSQNNFIGLQKIFNEKGKLIMVIDHDNLTWNADIAAIPNYPLLVNVKTKADGILRKYFGKQFAENYIRWNIFESCYFATNSDSPEFGIDWTDEDYPEFAGTRFYVVYDIVKENEYRGQVRMLIDASGNLLSSQKTEPGDILYNEGFKDFSGQPVNYNLNIKKALKLAEAYGLDKSKDVTTTTSYKWERDKNPASPVFNGNTRLIISQAKKSDHKSQGDVIFWTGYSEQWIFDPWTGKFIEKRKVKN